MFEQQHAKQHLFSHKKGAWSVSLLTTECVLSHELLLPCADVITQILTPTSVFNIILVSQQVCEQKY